MKFEATNLYKTRYIELGYKFIPTVFTSIGSSNASAQALVQLIGDIYFLICCIYTYMLVSFREVVIEESDLSNHKFLHSSGPSSTRSI